MRYLLFLLLPMISYGQQRILPTAYELRMDSLSMSHFNTNYIKATNKSRILSLNPVKWVKMTIKPRMNKDAFARFITEELLSNGDDIAVNDFDPSDYLNFASFDIRVKTYINHRLNLVTMVFVNGIQSNTYSYSIGFTVKLY